MYLFLDTETGGLDAEIHSLLTLACDAVVDVTQEPIAHFDVAIKHSVYCVDAAALRINNIDLVAHDTRAFTAQEVQRRFNDWLYSANTTREQIITVGWNIAFDLGFIYEQLFPKTQLQRMGISYHALDVCALVEFMILQNKLPPKRKLTQVAAYFGLDTSNAHDANYDNYLCRMVLRELMKL